MDQASDHPAVTFVGELPHVNAEPALFQRAGDMTLPPRSASSRLAGLLGRPGPAGADLAGIDLVLAEALIAGADRARLAEETGPLVPARMVRH